MRWVGVGSAWERSCDVVSTGACHEQEDQTCEKNSYNRTCYVELSCRQEHKDHREDDR